MKPIHGSLVGIVILAAATPSIAQMDIGAPGIALGSSLMSSDMISSNLAAPTGRGRESRVGPRPLRIAPLRPAATTYRRQPAVTERVKAQFVDFVAKRSPADAERVRADLARIDPAQAWVRITASDGLRPGDVSDAFTAYWILNWAIATGGDNQRAQTQAVRAQVRDILASRPAFAGLSEPQRQEMAEALMLNFLYQHDVFLTAQKRGDGALVARLKDAALARFQNEMHVDLRSLALTDQGFVKRG